MIILKWILKVFIMRNRDERTAPDFVQGFLVLFILNILILLIYE
jgi:hypothetical protein